MGTLNCRPHSMDFIRQFPRSIRGWVALYALVLMVYSCTRHLLFQSTAMDLSYFDQAAYLISQGQMPIVSFWGYHFLGGHGDWIVYGLSLLYRLCPSVYWLLGVQAIALASGGLIVWKLAQQAGLNKPWSNTMAAAYLLQPMVFNINMFDFHPEVMAVPLILGSVWAARAQRLGLFTILIILAMGCRDSLALNIAGLGVWLLLTKHRRAGAIALSLGVLWFYLVTQWLIPTFRPGGVESIARYAEFGGSIGEILASLVLKPGVWVARLAKKDNLFYLVLLGLPWAWGLKRSNALLPLIPALPTIVINLLTTYYPQKDITHQYSLPTIPFFVLAAIQAIVQTLPAQTLPAQMLPAQTLPAQTSPILWLRQRRFILLWSTIMFLCLSKASYLSRYFNQLDSWQTTRHAIAQVPPNSSLLATTKLATHLAHRTTLRIPLPSQTPAQQLAGIDYILLDRKNHHNSEKTENIDRLIATAQQDSTKRLLSDRDGIYLFGPH
jgi:uncharacterized membrane protein